MCPFIALVVLFQLIVLICDVTCVSIDFQYPLNETDVKLQLKEGSQQNFSYVLDDFDSKTRLAFNVKDPTIADVDSNWVELFQVRQQPYHADLVVRGKYVGFTHLDIFYETNQTDSRTLLKRIGIVVTVNENKKLSTAFTILVVILVGLNTINMGCALDTDVVMQTIKRPTALFIGFFTHYFFMPLFAFVIGKLLFEDVPYLRLSLFIFGCSPGGTGANMWTGKQFDLIAVHVRLQNCKSKLAITNAIFYFLFLAFNSALKWKPESFRHDDLSQHPAGRRSDAALAVHARSADLPNELAEHTVQRDLFTSRSPLILHRHRLDDPESET